MNIVGRVVRKIRSYGWRMPKGSIDKNLSQLNRLKEEKCYLRAISVPESASVKASFEEKRIIAHAYWYGELGRKQIFSLKSFLATQNIDIVEVWLWLDSKNGFEHYSENEMLQMLLPYLAVKRYDPVSEIMHTPFAKCKEMMTQEHNLAARADAFRVLMMYKYGGLYFDLDVMFLRDFHQLFLGDEFVYAWERQPFANSALMYCRKGSYITTSIVRKAIQKRSCLPWVLFRYDDRQMDYLMVYPCCFFDPLWMGVQEGMSIKSYSDLFCDKNELTSPKVVSFRDFFPGSYAFHWHNMWNSEIDDNSYFAQFELEFDEIICQLGERQ